MNDLDRIAINDMKHELCDITPCFECADFAYQVRLNGAEVRIFYGNAAREDQISDEQEAMSYSIYLKRAAEHLPVEMYVYDLSNRNKEEEYKYTFLADDNYIKN